MNGVRTGRREDRTRSHGSRGTHLTERWSRSTGNDKVRNFNKVKPGRCITSVWTRLLDRRIVGVAVVFVVVFVVVIFGVVNAVVFVVVGVGVAVDVSVVVDFAVVVVVAGGVIQDGDRTEIFKLMILAVREEEGVEGQL